MNRNHFIIALAAMALTSCSTVSHTASTSTVDTKICNLTVADLEVSTTKAAKTVDWKWSPLRSVSMSETKDNASGELLMEAGADVLVEPQYVVKRRGAFRGGSLTVTGYPATYRNFRSMTKADAEMIALANGTYVPGVPVIVDTNAAYSPVRRKKADTALPLFHKEEFTGGSFVSLVGGPSLDWETYFDSGFNLGLMYGKYGRSWGYYLKLSVVSFSDQVYEYENGGYVDDNPTTGILTVGAIKTLGRHNNIFMGIGVGGCILPVPGHTSKHRFGVPAEIGWQWHSGHFNALLGLNMTTPVTGNGDKPDVSPFVGVGYNF